MSQLNKQIRTSQKGSVSIHPRSHPLVLFIRGAVIGGGCGLCSPHHLIGRRPLGAYCTTRRRGGWAYTRDGHTHQEVCGGESDTQFIVWSCSEERDYVCELTTPTHYTSLTLYTPGGLLHTRPRPPCTDSGGHAHTPPHLHTPHTISHLHVQRRYDMCTCIAISYYSVQDCPRLLDMRWSYQLTCSVSQVSQTRLQLTR